jgi:hypothetical protein
MTRIDPEIRFWKYVDLSWSPGGCWLWTASKTSWGYGQLSGSPETSKTLLAHRLSYEIHKGPIPAGLELDHLCRVRHCVNPDHLEAVTRKVNQLRGNTLAAAAAARTACIHGHPFDEANTYTTKQGKRMCRACRRERMRRYTAAKASTETPCPDENVGY